jgi:hypothetical protein
VELRDALDEPRLNAPVRPRDCKEHLLRWMDALLGEVRELHQLVAGAEPELDPRCDQAKLVERSDVQPASTGLSVYAYFSPSESKPRRR